jgi:putative membrane protein
MMHGFGFGPYGWIWMIVSAIFWLAVIGGLVWLIVWAVRRSGTSQSNSYSQSGQSVLPGQSAKEIAQMRYARGEITREQYQQLLEDLSR